MLKHTVGRLALWDYLFGTSLVPSGPLSILYDAGFGDCLVFQLLTSSELHSVVRNLIPVLEVPNMQIATLAIPHPLPSLAARVPYSQALRLEGPTLKGIAEFLYPLNSTATQLALDWQPY